jgi:hypothetical protein
MMGGAISWVHGARLAGNVVEAPGFDPSLEKSSCPTSSQPPPPPKLADGEFATLTNTNKRLLDRTYAQRRPAK